MYAAWVFSRPFAAFLAVSRVCSAYVSPALRRRRLMEFAVDSSEDMFAVWIVLDRGVGQVLCRWLGNCGSSQ